jgi:hypothetical protein
MLTNRAHGTPANLLYGKFARPMSDSGKRTLAVPGVIIYVLTEHLHSYVAPGRSALLFTSPGGQPLRHWQ